MRAQLAQQPDNLRLASRLARLYINASRIDGDPRYLGYAQAALQPWWNQAVPPEEAGVLRATIRQSLHQFPQALADLQQVVVHDPSNAQAWLTLATVQTVIGQFAEAKTSCDRLSGMVPTLIVVTCLTNVGSVTGDARTSYDTLKVALQGQTDNDPGIRVWVLTQLAEMAVRLGDDRSAAEHFRTAFELKEPDGYLLGAYADFLLQYQRPDEVISLLKDKTRNDALLLRYAEALSERDIQQAQPVIRDLKQRFQAAALRGDTVHLRERARFELQLLREPAQAVKTAKANWAVQKEPEDLRILLQAAVAAKDTAAIESVKNWIDTTHFQDQRIAALLATSK